MSQGVVKICDYGLGIDYDNEETSPLDSSHPRRGEHCAVKKRVLGEE